MRSARAKVLHEIGGEPMIAWVLRAIAGVEAAPLVVVVGHQTREVEEAARKANPGAAVRFAIQPEQRGTGHAARCGMAALPTGFKGDVLIICGDMPMIRAATLQAFIAEHRKADAKLSFISVRVVEPGSYGRVVRDTHDNIVAIVEAKDAAASQLTIDEINSGTYLANAAFLRSALGELQPTNAQGEFYLTDIVAISRRHRIAIKAWRAADADEFAGINSREELALMETRVR
jgi:bifunctional UDP-N-acetylglucosamine pyrophosphorylase/glucosamine-1-phosphate N-acetyltransferase